MDKGMLGLLEITHRGVRLVRHLKGRGPHCIRCPRTMPALYVAAVISSLCCGSESPTPGPVGGVRAERASNRSGSRRMGWGAAAGLDLAGSSSGRPGTEDYMSRRCLAVRSFLQRAAPESSRNRGVSLPSDLCTRRCLHLSCALPPGVEMKPLTSGRCTRGCVCAVEGREG